jgi:hypothetical protein
MLTDAAGSGCPLSGFSISGAGVQVEKVREPDINNCSRCSGQKPALSL